MYIYTPFCSDRLAPTIHDTKTYYPTLIIIYK